MNVLKEESENPKERRKEGTRKRASEMVRFRYTTERPDVTQTGGSLGIIDNVAAGDHLNDPLDRMFPCKIINIGSSHVRFSPTGNAC